MPCKPSAACRARFVREFGLKAFRRPLDAGEQKRYETLMSRETDFLKGAQLVSRRCCNPRISCSASTRRPTQVEALRGGQPALVFALGHHARRGAVRRPRRAATWPLRRRREYRAAHARRSARPRSAERIRQPVAALRPHHDRQQGSPEVSRSSSPRPPLP